MFNPSVTMGDLQYQRNYAFSGAFIEYEGIAPPGTKTTDAGWIIIKYTNDATNTTASRLADDSIGFNKVWSQRASYTYSF